MKTVNRLIGKLTKPSPLQQDLRDLEIKKHKENLQVKRELLKARVLVQSSAIQVSPVNRNLVNSAKEAATVIGCAVGLVLSAYGCALIK